MKGRDVPFFWCRRHIDGRRCGSWGWTLFLQLLLVYLSWLLGSFLGLTFFPSTWCGRWGWTAGGAGAGSWRQDQGMARDRRVTRTATQQMTRMATQQMTRMATQQMTRTATQQMTRTATQQMTRMATQQMTRTATRQMTRTATQQMTRTATRQMTRTSTRQLRWKRAMRTDSDGEALSRSEGWLSRVA